MSSDVNARAGKALAGRWRAGMLDTFGTRVLAVLEDGRLLTSELVDEGPAYMARTVHERSKPEDMHDPDMSDPATRGAFLDVVREAWGSPLASLVNERSNRWAMIFLGGPVVHGATEAEALVAALEAAPALVRIATLILTEEV